MRRIIIKAFTHFVRIQMKIIPSKLEVAPYGLKMSEWVSGVEWMDTP